MLLTVTSIKSCLTHTGSKTLWQRASSHFNTSCHIVPFSPTHEKQASTRSPQYSIFFVQCKIRILTIFAKKEMKNPDQQHLLFAIRPNLKIDYKISKTALHQLSYPYLAGWATNKLRKQPPAETNPWKTKHPSRVEPNVPATIMQAVTWS